MRFGPANESCLVEENPVSNTLALEREPGPFVRDLAETAGSKPAVPIFSSDAWVRTRPSGITQKPGYDQNAVMGHDKVDTAFIKTVCLRKGEGSPAPAVVHAHLHLAPFESL